MPQIKEPVFRDLSLAFSAHPVTKRLTVLENAEAVKSSVKNIVRTNFYERPYSAFLGGNVEAQLFELSGPMLEYEVSKNVRQALDNYEPRAIIDDIRVKARPDRHELSVTVVFRVKNNKNPYEVEVLIERIR